MRPCSVERVQTVVRAAKKKAVEKQARKSDPAATAAAAAAWTDVSVQPDEQVTYVATWHVDRVPQLIAAVCSTEIISSVPTLSFNSAWNSIFYLTSDIHLTIFISAC